MHPDDYVWLVSEKDDGERVVRVFEVRLRSKYGTDTPYRMHVTANKRTPVWKLAERVEDEVRNLCKLHGWEMRPVIERLKR
ncbi:MAG: hypothetical protein WDA07_06205 [Leucobacter sp.]